MLTGHHLLSEFHNLCSGWALKEPSITLFFVAHPRAGITRGLPPGPLGAGPIQSKNFADESLTAGLTPASVYGLFNRNSKPGALVLADYLTLRKSAGTSQEESGPACLAFVCRHRGAVGAP